MQKPHCSAWCAGKARCTALSVPGVGEPFDGDDVGAVHLHRILRAAAHRASIHQHRAGAADAMLAADMHAERLQFVAEEIAEQHARLGLTRTASLPFRVSSMRDAVAGPVMQRRHGQRLRAVLRCGERSTKDALDQHCRQARAGNRRWRRDRPSGDDGCGMARKAGGDLSAAHAPTNRLRVDRDRPAFDAAETERQVP